MSTVPIVCVMQPNDRLHSCGISIWSSRNI